MGVFFRSLNWSCPWQLSAKASRRKRTWATATLRILCKPKFTSGFPFFCDEGKKSRIQKKEGFVWTPPRRYGPSSSPFKFLSTSQHGQTTSYFVRSIMTGRCRARGNSWVAMDSTTHLSEKQRLLCNCCWNKLAPHKSAIEIQRERERERKRDLCLWSTLAANY